MGQAFDHKHVLFVDDDPSSRRLVEKMLRSGAPGVRVTCVGDGAQALAVLDREPVDLLITDLAMPILGGIELILQVIRRGLGVALLVVSGRRDAQSESRALESGALAYFAKPVQAEPFIACVCKLLTTGSRPAPLEVVSLAGLTRIIHMERKTCALRVTLADAHGVLLFVAGELVDAREGELDGLPAALRMLAWDAPSVALEPLMRACERTIAISLSELLRRASADRHGASGAVVARERPPTMPGPAPEFRARWTGEQPTPVSRSAASSSPPSRAGSQPGPATPPVRPPRVAPPVGPPAPLIPPPPVLPLRSPPMASRNVTPPAVPPPPTVQVPPRSVITLRAASGPSRAPDVAAAASRQSEPPGVSASPPAASGPSRAPDVAAAAIRQSEPPGVSASPPASVVDAAPAVSPLAAAAAPGESSLAAPGESSIVAPGESSLAAPGESSIAAATAIAEASALAATAVLAAGPATTTSQAAPVLPAAAPLQDPDAEPPPVRAEASVSPANPVLASAVEPATDRRAAIAGITSDDYFELVDRARDLLRVAEFDVAEQLLLRALQVRPGDRVVQQNLRVLARRRAPGAEMNP